MSTTSVDDQCFFTSCKSKKKTVISFRGQYIKVCAEHAKRYGSSVENRG